MTGPLSFGDCHTHLDQYAGYGAGEISEILERADEAGVKYIVAAGTTLDSSRACIQMTKDYDIMYAGVGIHPMEANEPVDDEVYGALEALAKSSPKVICISEVGLDFLPASPDHATQYQVFRQHIRLAKSLRFPIIFHSRESHPEVFQTLREEQAGDVGGAMHYFQADEATAREAIDCGFFISLARPLTRLLEVQEAARAVPLEHIVLETDAAPQPFKKYRRNWTEPRHAADVARCLADVKGISVEEVAAVTTANLRRMLNRGTTLL